MELILDTKNKTIKIKTDKDTTAENLIKNIQYTLKNKLKDYTIKSIKTTEPIKKD